MTPVEAALQIADFKKGVPNPHKTKEAIEVIRQINKEFARESLRILAAEVRRLRKNSQWRPIETAPKFAVTNPSTGFADTPLILLMDDEGGIAVGCWHHFKHEPDEPENWSDPSGNYLPIFDPVKWRPLPDETNN
jgi:hypothetical protein